MDLIEVNDQQRKDIQAAELVILSELDRICCKHHIKYMIAYGTLIGAIRHNGFIPWDDDIDVCMPRSDFEDFKRICKLELGKEFFYQDNETDPEYFYLIDKVRLNDTVFRESYVSRYNIHHGIYIDIFPVDVIPDSKLKRSFQYYSFHFFRTGLMAKYLDLKARSGKKKIMMALLKGIYSPFTIPFLYKNAKRIASKYSRNDGKKVESFYSPYRKKDIFDREMFQVLERHIYENIEVNIPKKYDLYLTNIYGNYMELPPLDERNTRHMITELKLIK